MTPVGNYKKWLKAVSKYYSEPEDSIISGENRSIYYCTIRQVFYWLCFKDGIDLYHLSLTLGRHRTTILKSIKNQKNRCRIAEKEIWEKLTSSELADI